MRVKRYEAPNMAAALKMIREDLGPNAFVLSTRRVHRKDGDDRLKTLIEVSAASDLVEIKRQEAPAVPHRSNGDSGMLASLQQQVDELKRELASFRTEDRPREINVIKEELEQIRGLVEHTSDQWAEASAKNLGPILSALFRRLKRADVDERLAAKLVAIASGELRTNHTPNEKEALKVLFDVMKRQILVSGPVQLLHSGPKVVVLVGPTGVGKTTTLAKLAAHYSMFKKKKVGLLTIDTFRIGAVEQLGTYASILELPLKVANTPEQMTRFVKDYSNMDLVLIDTGGRSQKDRAKMGELLSFVKERHDMYHEVHLLLSAATKNRDLVEITREFGKMVIDYVIFTKLDECNSFGGILNESFWTQKPISYFTTGQNVPDDMEVADAGKTVELILTGSLPGKDASDTIKRERL